MHCVLVVWGVGLALLFAGAAVARGCTAFSDTRRFFDSSTIVRPQG